MGVLIVLLSRRTSASEALLRKLLNIDLFGRKICHVLITAYLVIRSEKCNPREGLNSMLLSPFLRDLPPFTYFSSVALAVNYPPSQRAIGGMNESAIIGCKDRNGI